MEKKVLIAYGTAAGSTGEVAECVGEEMRKAGAQVDVQPVEAVKDASEYDAVVVGSAVRIGKLIRNTRRFLRRHRKTLRQVPVAYFVVCLTVKEKTPENVEKARGYANPMLKVAEPVSLGLFGGCMDPEKLTGFFAMTMKEVPEEDHRDWDQIRTWAQQTLKKLFP
jgi:menaquinone-dependent protoporphyrinogen oxidase